MAIEIKENGRLVLERRYLKRDKSGKLEESVEGMFRRVAEAIAQMDKRYGAEDTSGLEKQFYDMMTKLYFLPNSPTLMNAGRELGQLSACFVLPVPDSMEGIFEAIKQAALIHKSGGGTGFSFSRLRQKGAAVNSTGGVASGPISFMKVFNTATEAVKQGGTRRGANMGILRVDHPDILEFIDCKKNKEEITNFNISIAVTEAFMLAVENGEEYDLIDPAEKKTVGKLSAREVFDKIVYAAWLNGEPGILFIDRLNRDNIVPSQGEIESTNPCGEQPLLPYESCNLGSINLPRMLVKTERGYEIDYELLGSTVDLAVHFLDNVIDANKYPIREIAETTRLTRKIGLGVMGWADLLLRLGVPYDSEEGVALADKVMGFINARAKNASAQLAEQRGPFPLFDKSILRQGRPMRNGTVTTIAPTGTLSIIAGVSGGVEPVFAYVFIRNVMDGDELLEVNPILKEELERRGLYSDELMRRIAQEGSLAHIEEIPEDMRLVYVSAHDVAPQWHIKMQAAFQKHTDNAVSKTVNFSNSATVDDVREVYLTAYQEGCKGVTIYRDGSRDGQVLNIGKVERGEKTPARCEECQNYSSMCQLMEKSGATLVPRARPEITQGLTERCKIGCGNLYVTVNYDEMGICEVFTNTGRHGGCPSQSEATSRLVSIALRAGVSIETIIEQLKGIRCPSTIRQQGMKVMSCPDAIARTIEKVLGQQKLAAPYQAQQAGDTRDNSAAAARTCPECGAKVEHEGGCIICRNCGYSKCG